MKSINNSCIEVLPSLLDKSKDQTIRPAWETTDISDGQKHKIDSKLIISQVNLKESGYKQSVVTTEKPARYKVGDKVKLYWNKDSKYEIFCSKCGNQRQKDSKGDITEGFWVKCDTCGYGKKTFDKLLGNVEITDIFKIKLGRDSIKIKDYYIYFLRTNIGRCNWGSAKKIVDDFAKLDGFKSAEDMFPTLDKMYDLSKPKEFWVYRWKW